MRTVVLVLGIAVLALGALYLSQSGEVETPETTPATQTSGDDMSSMGMPAEGSDVDEMEVVEVDDVEEMDSMAAGDAVIFEVSGFSYGYSMDEIRVKEGDTVTINFVSDDGFHDWVVDEFDAATEKVRPGTPTSVTFVADKAGTYEFYCSVGSHRAQGMVGSLIVE